MKQTNSERSQRDRLHSTPQGKAFRNSYVARSWLRVQLGRGCRALDLSESTNGGKATAHGAASVKETSSRSSLASDGSCRHKHAETGTQTRVCMVDLSTGQTCRVARAACCVHSSPSEIPHICVMKLDMTPSSLLIAMVVHLSLTTDRFQKIPAYPAWTW